MTTKTSVNHITATIAIAYCCAGGLIFAALPAAADIFDTPQVTVKYEDLNISNSQGVTTLYSRIRSAASSVCSQFDGSGINGAMRRNACMEKAILGAVTKVNSSALYALSGVKARTDVPVRLVSLSKLN